MSRTLLLLSCLITLILPAATFAKPAPPAELTQMFKDFLHIEEPIEEGEWDEALTWLESLEADREFAAAVERSVAPENYRAFRAGLRDLEDALRSEDRELVLQRFLDLHKSFVVVMESFDLKIHPLVYILQNDFDEMQEAIDDWDLSELLNEIKDVDAFYPQFSGLLLEKGLPIKLVDEFTIEMERFKDATLSEDRATAQTSLTKLANLFNMQTHLISR